MRRSRPQEESGLGAWCIRGPCRMLTAAPNLALWAPAPTPQQVQWGHLLLAQGGR